MKKLKVEGLDEDLREKMLVNELNSLMHRKDYNLIEKAMMNEELAKKRGCYIQDLAEELKCTKKELYIARKILDAPEEVLERVRAGDISEMAVARILYSLKDEDSAEEVVNEVIEKELNTIDSEKLVARINNPKAALNQLHSIMWRLAKKIKELKDSKGLDKSRSSDFEKLFRELKVDLISLQDKVCTTKIFE